MKPKITPETIKHVASLTRLSLTAAETKKYQNDLEEILKSFDIINSLPTESEPSFQPVHIDARLREDKREESLSRDKALANTKHKEKGFFKGPKAV
ncbi:MAG: Asp-tRNA(Asn)/Glu-tRNA(Gln) amidotransferase subunit GatC [Candidatus Aenigmarchaeota archaeon]|nr:Asp-tRNA(Asn)/Glu-tRNA(Gln) amidotransferase subunit GatC [Candidatus Aenigmarchaeota archaeon]MDI6722843.1 Asp-tRNA(Asn)/Glu-tRNA(Gln) amidotransferase subunit GatC [Candidatus Aenigmarchaeota archaeon]